MSFVEIGRFLLIAGVSITLVGVVFMLSDKLPVGNLPGDINIARDNFRISIPIMTCILLSVVLTVVANFFSK
jgi:hypothetical protein